MLLGGTAWQLSTMPASALKWETLERVAKDPSLLQNAFDKEKTDGVCVLVGDGLVDGWIDGWLDECKSHVCAHALAIS